MRPFLRTRWKISKVPKLVSHGKLNVTLVCDTSAPAVIRAIEEAAAAHGIRLERLPDE